MKNGVFILLVLLAGGLADAKVFYVQPPADPSTAGITIDHNCVDLSAIPQIHLAPAASLRVLLRHASVGQGIDWGLECLAGNRPTNPSCCDYPAGTYDRGKWVLELRGGNSRDKVDDLVTQAAIRTDDFDVFTMKFCYIDALGDNHPDWDYYRTNMEQLELDYPGKVFVWWTIPLTRDGMPGTDDFNALVRSYCRANGKILFDIAEIECHDPNGLKHTNSQGCEVICQDYTKEIHAGHLNVPGRIRVASALWHLMARIGGWHKGSIQAAIDDANDGDMVIVHPGIYKEDINFLGKNVTLTSTRPTKSNVVKSTTIDGFVHFRGTEDPNCTLTGFNINESILGYDREIDPPGENHTHATISHCILENIMTGCGGVIQTCDGIISNCVIANTTYACVRPWPVPAIVGCHGLIRNCTMVNMWDGIELLPGGTCTIENCLILCGWSPIVVPGTATLNISYCNLYAGPHVILGTGTINLGPGIIDNDPYFVQPADWTNDGDYHLRSQAGRWNPNSGSWVQDDVTSPCIDTGDPMTPIMHELFPNGGIINMGAYGGTAEASKSYFGKPLCAKIIAGDINGDCEVNFNDFTFIALHWLQEHTP
jgi:hypothetical protein